MWWLARSDGDMPSMQLETHWHLEMADMPADVCGGAGGQRAQVLQTPARDRGVTYTGEFLSQTGAWRELSPLYAFAEEMAATCLGHLAGKAAEGYLFWIWNPLREGTNAGAWSLRELDGSNNRSNPRPQVAMVEEIQ